MTMDNDMLNDRTSAHGEFEENSRATLAIIRALQAERNWSTLPDGIRHALYMIAHKMARIAAGDPGHLDHWDDIAGYASCVSDRIRKPVIPYDAQDVYSAMALGWGISREEALQRVQAITDARKAATANGRAESAEVRPEVTSPALPSGLPKRRSVPANDRPGTPEDGGHHAAMSDVENAADMLRRELDKGE